MKTIFRLFLLAGLFLILFSLSIPAFAANKEFGLMQNSVIGSEFVIPGPVDSGLSGDPSEAPVRIRVPPTVTTLISNTSATTAVLNGYLDSTGSADRVQVSFQWDIVSHVADGGNYAHETASRSVRRAGSFSANLNSLSPDMDYFYRARASGDGIAYGQEMSFNIPQGESPAYTLTVNVTGSGTVTKSLEQPGYNAGSEVTLTPISSPGWVFSGWSGGLTGNSTPVTIIMDGNKNVTATFVQTVYSLTIKLSGQGRVERDNAGPYHNGDTVNLTAVPSAGWAFSAWSMDINGNDNPISITVNGNKIVTANFIQNSFSLTISHTGQGDIIKSPNLQAYNNGADVVLTASPGQGWVFSNWVGDLTGNTNPATMKMDRNKSVSAVFIQNPYSLNISQNGQGSVIKSPDQPVYIPGTVITLKATPSPGWMFSGWSGDLKGNSNPATVVMDRNKSITTDFTILNGGGGDSGGSSGGGGAYIEPPPTSDWVTVSLTGLGANPDLITDNSGEAREKSQLKNGDGKVIMDVAKGTILTDSHGVGLKAMSAVRPSAVPDPPAGDILLASYVLGPANAKFNPPLNLTLTYDPPSLTAGAMENNLYLAAWDGIEWSELESKVDTTAKTVSASIAHFSQYALLLKAPLSAPAKFVVEELTVVPPEVKAGEPVTIKTTVLNNGGKQGEYLLVLKINGIEEARRDFYLDIGKTEMITFQVSKEAPGEYKVDVNGKTARLMILAPIIRNLAPVPVPETISIPATNVITTHEDILIPTVTKELAPVVKTDIKLYIWVLNGIIGVMVLGIIFRVIFRKKA